MAIYKPSTTGTKGGPAFLINGGPLSSPPTVTINGTTHTATLLNTIDEGQGPRSQYIFPSEVANNTSGFDINAGGQTFHVENGQKAYEGDSGNFTYRGPGRGDLAEGEGGGFAPGNIGYGSFPAYQGGKFPKVSTINYTNIKTAPYSFTDPQKFAAKYGEFNRGETAKNFSQAQGMALQTLDTELQGLSNYVPAASALKRSQTAADNVFNQAQRTAQINQVMPNAAGDLEAQRQRASAYANGRLPDTMEDRALELGVRSQAADQAFAGGFGASSSAARKASDLMSAQQRLQIGQYGEQLLGSNMQLNAQLNLAPTEYSNAGQQVSVMPSLSASQLTSQNQQELDANTLISPTNALSSTISQNQFKTNLEQSTRQFNAQMGWNTQQFNANAANQFAMAKFGYDVGYAGSVAGAAQTNTNTQLGLEQQQAARDTAITTGAITAGAGLISSIASALAAPGKKDNTDNSSQSSGQQQVTYPDGSSASMDENGNIVTETPGNGGTIIKTVTGPSGEASSVITDASGNPVASSGANEAPAPMTPAPSIGGDSANISLPSESVSTPEMSSGGEFTPLALASSPRALTSSQKAALKQSESLIAKQKLDASPPPIKAFSRDLQVDTSALVAHDPKELTRVADRALQNAGVHQTQQPNTTAKNVDFQGNPQYHALELQNDKNTSAGVAPIDQVTNFLKPLGVKVNDSFLNQVKTAASDVSFANQLNTAVLNKDPTQFVNAVLDKFHEPLIKEITSDPKTIGGMDTAYSAYRVFQNWNAMSPAQKSLSIASLGIQSYHTATGVNLSAMPIPGTQIAGHPAFTVGGALNLAALGYNVADIVQNWGDMNDAQKIILGSGTLSEGAALASSLGLIGKGGGIAMGGITNAVNAAQAAQTGALTAAEFGAYATGALGVVGAGAAAYETYKGWGQGGVAGRVSGIGSALGFTAAGAAIGSVVPGIGTAVGATVGAVIGAISFAGQQIKTGKSQNQQERDAFRADLKDRGLVGEDFKIQLADGSIGDIGIDGHGGQHQVTHPELIAQADAKSAGKPANVWDTDYTNDMDFVSGMAGTTLTRLLYGGRSEKGDQIGAELGNVMLGKVGYGKEMTEENYNSVMANARGVYAKAGIQSKEDAYLLIDRAYKEGRISSADAIGSQQAINLMYDGKKGFATAQKLMKGRTAGVEVMRRQPARPDLVTPPIEGISKPSQTNMAGATKALGGATGSESSSENIIPYATDSQTNSIPLNYRSGASAASYRAGRGSFLNLSKEDIRARNRNAFQGVAA